MFRGWDGLTFYPKQNKIIVETLRIKKMIILKFFVVAKA